MQHMPYLDGIRGLAILLVMFHHMTILTGHSRPEQVLYGMAQFGPHGVDLFFVLSGFLITGILLDTRSDRHFFRNFYARRTLRIFPLYYLLVAFSFLVVPWCLAQLPQFGAKLARFSTVSDAWPWYALYASNFLIASNNAFRHGILDVSWSLAIEEQYYLVGAVGVYFLTRRKAIVICAVLLGVLPFLRLASLTLGTSPLQIYVLTPTRLDGVLWGSLLALITRDSDRLRMLLDRYLKPAGVVCGIVILIIAAAGKWNYLGATEQVFGYSAVALTFAAIVWTTSRHDGILRRIFDQRMLRFFGVYSYSLYLFHLPVRALIRDTIFGEKQFSVLSSSPIPGQLLFYAIATIAVVPLSLFSWYAVEQPFLRMKSKFASSTAPSQSREIRYEHRHGRRGLDLHRILRPLHVSWQLKTRHP